VKMTGATMTSPFTNPSTPRPPPARTRHPS
jgi:hypothetical protein